MLRIKDVGDLVRLLLAQGRTARALVRRDRRALGSLPVVTVEGDVLGADGRRVPAPP